MTVKKSGGIGEGQWKKIAFLERGINYVHLSVIDQKVEIHAGYKVP